MKNIRRIFKNSCRLIDIVCKLASGGLEGDPEPTEFNCQTKSYLCQTLTTYHLKPLKRLDFQWTKVLPKKDFKPIWTAWNRLATDLVPISNRALSKFLGTYISTADRRNQQNMPTWSTCVFYSVLTWSKGVDRSKVSFLTWCYRPKILEYKNKFIRKEELRMRSWLMSR